MGGDIILSVQGLPVMADSFGEISEKLTEVPGDRVDVVVSGAARLVELEGSLAGGPD